MKKNKIRRSKYVNFKYIIFFLSFSVFRNHYKYNDDCDYNYLVYYDYYYYFRRLLWLTKYNRKRDGSFFFLREYTQSKFQEGKNSNRHDRFDFSKLLKIWSKQTTNALLVWLLIADAYDNTSKWVFCLWEQPIKDI